MQPRYLLHTTQKDFEVFAQAFDLEYTIETQCPLYEGQLLRVEPLRPPVGEIYYTTFRHKKPNANSST